MTDTIYPSVFLEFIFISVSFNSFIYIFAVFCLLFLHLLNTNFSH